MISVLKQLLVDPGKVERVFFYWTICAHRAFGWFSKLMIEVYEQDNKHILQVRHFLTSVKDDDRDILGLSFCTMLLVPSIRHPILI